MIATTEDSQLRSIEDSLQHRFEGRLPATQVHREVEASRQQFQDARIRTYVPVLVQREALMRLRRLPAAVL
jgi:hypothetical protein